jgi:hypothetical protein
VSAILQFTADATGGRHPAASVGAEVHVRNLALVAAHSTLTGEHLGA